MIFSYNIEFLGTQENLSFIASEKRGKEKIMQSIKRKRD
jgi:hypothetical protein